MNRSKVHSSNEELLTIFRGLAFEWRSQFDNPPDHPLDFTIQSGELYLNGVVICPVALIDPDAYAFNAENILMLLTDDTCVTIYIIWSADEKISISIELQPASAILEGRD